MQPKATLKFPLGEVSLEEREDDEVKRVLSINGIVKDNLLNGVCTAQYEDEELKLRYSFKVFLCSLSLPSLSLSLFGFVPPFFSNTICCLAG